MDMKTSLVLLLAVVSVIPLGANAKEKKSERAMLESMDAVACGAKTKGLTGLGTLWASVGVTKVNSDEKVCPQYLVRTDTMDYEVRPTDLKHAALLPVGQEVGFKLKGNRVYLTEEDHGRKTRSYEVVSMKPASPDNNEKLSSSK